MTRLKFSEISAAAWEHPADRAGLQALRAIPGFDLLVKKTIGRYFESLSRALFQDNAVKVGPNQFVEIYDLRKEIMETFDLTDPIEVFVSQNPSINAGAYGMDKPFIVINSASVSTMSVDELRVMLGHEIGHIMSGHVLYKTMLSILLNLGLSQVYHPTALLIIPLRLALLEWSRKSELSADRAALLASQNLDDCIGMFLKMAGGSGLNLEAYKEQVAESEISYNPYSILNILDRTHPFNTMRVSELQKWAASDEYRDILAGNYRKTTDPRIDHVKKYGNDVAEAVVHYAVTTKDTAVSAAVCVKDKTVDLCTDVKSVAVKTGSFVRSLFSR